jgi:hypothetical protein
MTVIHACREQHPHGKSSCYFSPLDRVYRATTHLGNSSPEWKRRNGSDRSNHRQEKKDLSHAKVKDGEKSLWLFPLKNGRKSGLEHLSCTPLNTVNSEKGQKTLSGTSWLDRPVRLSGMFNPASAFPERTNHRHCLWNLLDDQQGLHLPWQRTMQRIN